MQTTRWSIYSQSMAGEKVEGVDCPGMPSFDQAEAMAMAEHLRKTQPALGNVWAAPETVNAEYVRKRIGTVNTLSVGPIHVEREALGMWVGDYHFTNVGTMVLKELLQIGISQVLEINDEELTRYELKVCEPAAETAAA
jgi:hypothetical protein